MMGGAGKAPALVLQVFVFCSVAYVYVRAADDACVSLTALLSRMKSRRARGGNNDDGVPAPPGCCSIVRVHGHHRAACKCVRVTPCHASLINTCGILLPAESAVEHEFHSGAFASLLLEELGKL